METYCFDMDGVICEEDSKNYSKRTPNLTTIYIMKMLVMKGKTVIIHTGRHILNLKVTKAWLEKHNVLYTHLQFGKPVADVYIDDKGLRFKEWTPQLEKYLL